MNAKHDGNHLFGGTANGQPPFVLATDADGNVTGVTYQGNTTEPGKEIEAGVALEVGVPGANASGAGPRGVITDSRSGADFFNHLISLQNNLRAGDTDAILSTDAPALRLDEENFIYHITNNGAVQTRLETAATIADDRALSLVKEVSQEADADFTETIVSLNQAQYAYQAAVQSGAGIMKVSLLDYLH
jgi:flagellar hook-associated protein 3 FlgL